MLESITEKHLSLELWLTKRIMMKNRKKMDSLKKEAAITVWYLLLGKTRPAGISTAKLWYSLLSFMIRSICCSNLLKSAIHSSL